VANIIKSGWNFGLPAGEAIARVGLHFAFTGGPPTTAELIDIANDFMTAYDTHGKSLTASEVVLDSVDLTDLTSPTSAVGESTHSTIAGTRGDSDNPSPLCATTIYGVSRRFRGGHPKSYWPFGVSGDLGSYNRWSSGFITAVDAGVQALITECLTSTHGGVAITDWVCVSYYEGFDNFTEPSGRARVIPRLRATPVVDSMFYKYLMPEYGVQRRRRGKV
jgi:hypothetical protein